MLAYLEMLKEDAKEEYDSELLAYRIRGGKEPPKIPEILKPPRERIAARPSDDGVVDDQHQVDPRWAHVKRPTR